MVVLAGVVGRAYTVGNSLYGISPLWDMEPVLTGWGEVVTLMVAFADVVSGSGVGIFLDVPAEMG